MLDIVLIALFIISGLASFAFWVVSIVQLIQRHDLKNSKGLWAVAIVLIGPIGSMVFFFMEGRKKLGIWTLVAGLLYMVVSVADILVELSNTTIT